MSMSFKPLLLVAALGLATSAHAADQPASPHDHGPAAAPATAPAATAAPAAKSGMMAMDGMSGGMMDMGPMHCMGLSGQRLSGLKTELDITDRQLRAWNAFAAAVKTGAHPMPAGMTMPMPMKPGGMTGGGGMMATMMSKPLPERLAHHEMMMKAHLKALHRVRTAVAGLYRVLTPEQRVIADKRLCSGMA